METHGRETRVLAFGNQKGGVTKTSTVVNVSAALAERGRSVLVWDLDVNCGSTRHFGIPNGVNVYGTFEVMTGEEAAGEVIITREDSLGNIPENVHLIPAHTKLEGIEAALAKSQGPFASGHDTLRGPVESLLGKYDYIFLDTAPNMTPPTKAAYMAANYFALTAVPEPFAIEGLINAIQYITHARKGGNADLKLVGVIMNQVPGRLTRLARSLLERVDEHFGQGESFMRRYETFISQSTIVPSAQEACQTLFEFAPDHKLTHQFRALANEIESRLDAIEGRTLSASGGGVIEAKPAAAVMDAHGAVTEGVANG